MEQKSSVEEFYWSDRPRYYAALDGVRTAGGDLTAWLEYKVHVPISPPPAQAESIITIFP